MSNRTITFTAEAEAGPVMRTAMDVLEFAGEILDEIPEWEEEKRQEMASRMGCLLKMAAERMQVNLKLKE